MQDQQTDYINCDVDTVPDSKRQGEACHLLVDLFHNPHLWSWTLGNDRKNEIVQYKHLKWFSLTGCFGLTLREMLRNSGILKELRVEPLLLCITGDS